MTEWTVGGKGCGFFFEQFVEHCAWPCHGDLRKSALYHGGKNQEVVGLVG